MLLRHSNVSHSTHQLLGKTRMCFGQNTNNYKIPYLVDEAPAFHLEGYRMWENIDPTPKVSKKTFTNNVMPKKPSVHRRYKETGN